ncbi:MAG: glycosyltransferase family 2 protein [Pseudomonadota bacterium]
MNDPQIAILIAAWKAEKTLERAVVSAQAQSVPVEIIIVDDASPDDTLALAKRLAADDPRITVLAQTENGGPAAARNRAIAQSTAPWLTVLDSDDYMEADRLAALLALAEQHDADFVADDIFKVDEADPNGPRSRMYADDRLGEQWLSTASFVEANLSSKHGGRRELGFLKPLMRRSFLEAEDLSYVDMILGEDYVLYATALASGARFLLVDPKGYIAVVRPDSLSGWHPTHAHADLMAADQILLDRPDLPEDARDALRIHKTEQHKKWAWRRLIDAKREKSLSGALSAFQAPLPVAIDLAGKLVTDVFQRATGRHSTQK